MSPPRTISAKQLRAKLLDDIQAVGSYRKFAARHGMTSAHYWNVVSGRKDPGPKLLALLGYAAEPPRYRKLAP